MVDICYDDPTDVYYAIVLVGVIVYFANQAIGNTIQEAKDYDGRGAMANAVREEKIKRDRAAAREKVRTSDMAYDRLQAEKRDRSEKREGWLKGWKTLTGLGEKEGN